MIELVIKKYLDKRMDEPVFLEQKILEGAYIVFEKISSGKKNNLLSSVFAFQSYADSMQKTCELNERLKAAVEDLINLESIVSVRLNSDYNFTDTSIKKYRYQAVYEIKHY